MIQNSTCASPKFTSGLSIIFNNYSGIVRYMIFLHSLRILLIILSVLFYLVSEAQTDTIPLADTSRLRDQFTDSTVIVDTAALNAPPLLLRFDTLLYSIHPFYRFDDPLSMLVEKRKWFGKEAFFYMTMALLFFFALIRSGFNKYMKDLFRIFFRTTLKQRQVKEQLMQAPLPSLLLNLLFLFSSAFFLNLVFQHYQLGKSYNFWYLFGYTILGIGAVYMIKFITLKLCGWLFRMVNAIDAYIFIVFTTNKILGILLLPLIVLLAFTEGMATQVAISAGALLAGGLFLYRFYLSYTIIHRQIKVSFFHFFLYLAGFEIVPLLLINKLLFTFLS